MHEKETASSGGLNLADVYYILFRHKWKIIFCAIAGIGLAAALYLTTPPVYESEAKLMIKYIQDSKAVAADPRDIQTPDTRGTAIINSEIEILKSHTLACAVVDAVGPEKILGPGRHDRNLAANILTKNMTVEVPRGAGKIIRVVFQHTDPAIVYPVMTNIISEYKKQHLKIHRQVDTMDDWLTQESAQLRFRLNQTEEELRKLKQKYGVISVSETKRALILEMSQKRQELSAAEAQLQEHKVTVAEAGKFSAAQSASTTNELGVPGKILTDYKNLCAQLNMLLARHNQLAVQYTPENPMVVRLQEQVADAEQQKQKMERENPQLLTLNVPVAPSAGTNAAMVDVYNEVLRTRALEAKVAFLKGQLESIKAEAAKLEEAESEISQLERKKELEENYLKTFTMELEKARIEGALGSGALSNIPVVQEPTPPVRSIGKLKKPLVMILALGFGSGLGLAFLIEMFLDQSVKRATDLERKLRLPIMLSIPFLSRNGWYTDAATGKKRGWWQRKPKPAVAAPGTGMELALWNPRHVLHTFHTALCDRLITYFEVRNMTHKPKLVAVTSCSRGAGVTTVATGLAAALSETGDGNVLLVDMGQEQGAAHPFYKGKPGCGLSDVLESEKRQEALVQENLYMVKAQDGEDQAARLLPKKLSHLVPKLKASEFDYIIFDMPAISQTSISSVLAGFMDMTLVVVESEKTNREVLKQAVHLLGENKANVNTILNKGRKRVPEWLHKEL